MQTALRSSTLALAVLVTITNQWGEHTVMDESGTAEINTAAVHPGDQPRKQVFVRAQPADASDLFDGGEELEDYATSAGVEWSPAGWAAFLTGTAVRARTNDNDYEVEVQRYFPPGRVLPLADERG